MIRTGDWGIPDLIRYLVAVEDSLTQIEMTRLRETVAFTKEEVENGAPPVAAADQKQSGKTRFKAMDLYEPSVTLRELGLPVIAWGMVPKWRASSDEGLFT